MMNVPNEEIGFTKNSPDALSFSTSPSIQQQNIQQCLKNLFQTPSQGIEQAFNIIVKSLEEQRQESQKILSDHTLLKEENLLLTETLNKIETKLNASETREIKLEESMKRLDEESKNLRMTLNNSSGLGGNNVAMASELTSLQQEVRMMSFNLELDNAPAIAEAVDDLVQSKKFDDQKNEENVEIPPPTFSQLSNNSQQIIERHDDKETGDSSPNTKCPVAATRSFENNRGSRVGKFRFDVQDTLAARLRRLEVDKEHVKTQLINIKGMIKNDSIGLAKRVVSIETFLVGFDEANGDTLPQEYLPLANDLIGNNSDVESTIKAESILNPRITFSATTDLLPKKNDTERPFVDSSGEIKDKFIKKVDQTSQISEARAAAKNDFNIAAASGNDVKTDQKRCDQTSLNQSKEIDDADNSFIGKLYESSDKAKADTIEDASVLQTSMVGAKTNKDASVLQTSEVGAETSQHQRDLAISISSTEMNRTSKSPIGRVDESPNEREAPGADTVEGDFSIVKVFVNGADSNHSSQTVLNPSNVINQHSSTFKVEKSANNTEADTKTSDICIVQDLGSGAESSKSDDERSIMIPSKDMGNPHGNSHKETKKKQNIRSFSKRQSLFRHLEDQEYRIRDNFEDMSSRLRALEILCNGRDTPNFLASKHSISTKGSEAIGEGNLISDDSDNETLRNSVAKMMAAIDSKVSKEFLYEELKKNPLHSSMHSEKNEEIESVINGDNFTNFKSHVQSQLLFLKENKANMETLNNAISSSNDMFQQKLDVSLVEQDNKIKTSISTLHLAVNECKENIRVIDSQLLSPINPSNTDLEERMKDAFESMESNLREELTSRLQCLKQIEDNVERFASQLAEIPDQDQIKKMLSDLENVGLQHAEDDTVHSIIENMKNELKEKMTKEQVLGLVRQILRGAKDLITRNATNDSSLMVGYRCIGCSNYNPQGVNKTIASKVNHNKLPHGKGFSPSAFPHFNTVPGQTAKFTKGNVPAPVYYRRDTPSSFIRRSRTPSSFGLRRSRLRSSTRPISADK